MEVGEKVVSVARSVLKMLGDETAPIVILTGSGISAESGLATFRDNGGLWEGHRVEDVATPEAFIRDPETVHRFYNERRRRLLDPSIKPNAAHVALAELEKKWPASVTIITQNVDNLHERGGSLDVIHMHGELLKVRDLRTGEVRRWHGDCDDTNLSGDNFRGRPHIVWFGEAILESSRITEALAQCGLFLCIGTAGQVYPAAGFVHEACSPSVECNLEPTAITDSFDFALHAPATQVIPTLVSALLQHH